MNMNFLTICLSSILLIMALVFFLRSKIVRAMSWILKIFFPILLILGFSAIFFPQIFNYFADLSLRQAGTYKSLNDFENNLNPINNIEDNINSTFNDILNSFSSQDNNSNVEVEENDQNNKDENIQNDQGFFTNNIYSSLVDTLGLIYRIIAIFISIIGSLIIVYLSYSTMGASQINDLQKRIEKLEENT